MAKHNKYLLYIDILGFSQLVEKNYGKVKKLFKIIDQLNVHRHGAFKTVVFSDTILTFNNVAPKDPADHEYLVMYACEFVQDLLLRSTDLQIQFRAVLTYGDFFYQRLQNVEEYHGKGLIKAYCQEKQISGIGMFIDKKLLTYNKIYRTLQFDEDFHFVFLTQALERLNAYGIPSFPIHERFFEDTLEFSFIDRELKVLKTIKENMDCQTDSKIRGKYLQTYHLYKLRYGTLIDFFEKNNFDFRAINPDADWDTALGHFF